MEPKPNKPTKKRRRWLIVSLVLVFVSLFSWWNWPRGDARFVGKWGEFDDGDSQPHTVTNFRPSGMVEIHFSLETLPVVVTTWAIVDGRLVFGLPSDRWWSGVAGSMTDKWNSAFGTSRSYSWINGEQYPIKSVRYDEIVLAPPINHLGAMKDTVYRRLPE